jgi:hypothetical protein
MSSCSYFWELAYLQEAHELVGQTTYIHSISTATGIEHTHDVSNRF